MLDAGGRGEGSSGDCLPVPFGDSSVGSCKTRGLVEWLAMHDLLFLVASTSVWHWDLPFFLCLDFDIFPFPGT